MATQNLNEVQRAFIAEDVRPVVEYLLAVHARLSAFCDEYDNQASPIAATGDDLGDGPSGDAPRADAPVLIGTNLTALRSVAGNMRDQLSGATRNVLISKAVRPLHVIVRGV